MPPAGLVFFDLTTIVESIRRGGANATLAASIRLVLQLAIFRSDPPQRFLIPSEARVLGVC